jgi:hypothetical protein
MDTLTQGKRILRYLKAHKYGATIGDMSRVSGSLYPWKRVAELREQGHNIIVDYLRHWDKRRKRMVPRAWYRLVK